MKLNLLINKIERNYHIIMLVILMMMLLSPLAYSQTPCTAEFTETHTDVTCNGSMNGTITVSSSIPNSSFDYLWNDGNTNKDRLNLSAGTYTLTVSDGEYCNAEITVTINQPAELLVTESHLASTCGGIINDVIVSVSGGNSPYSFLWNDGDTNDNRSQLSGSSYTVTVTDAGGCSKQLTISNNNNVPFPNKITKQTTISCRNLCDGAIKVTPLTNSPPYTYLWSTGETTQIISNICMGTYTVTVTNSQGCTGTASHFLCGPKKLTPKFTKTEITANGANDGTITWNTTGGTPPYSYLWSDGYLFDNRVNISPGKYTITVTDAHGCTATKKITWLNPAVRLSQSDNDFNILNISPNPSIDKFDVEINVSIKSEYEIVILGVDGRVVLISNYELNEGQQTISFDLTDEPKGVYTLNIYNSERRFIKKLVLL